MNAVSQDSSSADRPKRSPFWPVAVVFLALIIGYSLQLWNLWDQRGQLHKTEAAYMELMPQAKSLNAKLQNVSLDLLQLSKSSEPARQIVQEFNIRSN